MIISSLVSADASADSLQGPYVGSSAIKFQPNLIVGTEHRTNVYLEEGETGGGTPEVAGTALLVNPSFKLTANTQALDALTWWWIWCSQVSSI